ncbi:MAG: PilW family protein [Bacillota bacterium]
MRWRSQTGSSLIELLVGGAIALIAFGVIISMQIDSYRAYRSDELRFAVETEAATALDRITRDLRMASAVAGIGTSEVTLTVGGQPVVYRHESGSQEVVRIEEGVERVIGRQVEQMGFFLEGDGRTVRVEWLARLPDGGTFLLISKASPRVRAGG